MAFASNPQAIAAILDVIYPVGSIIEWVPVSGSSVDLSTAAKVAARYGGTWEAYGAGRMIMAASDSYPVGNAGGSINHAHTISDAVAKIGLYSTNPPSIEYVRKETDGYVTNNTVAFSGTFSVAGRTQTRGAEVAGSTDIAGNLPPYITAYRWRRIA